KQRTIPSAAIALPRRISSSPKFAKIIFHASRALRGIFPTVSSSANPRCTDAAMRRTWHWPNLLVNSINAAVRLFMPEQETPTDRVLIVEDEETARRGYEALLHKWGLDVLGVPSAEDALARFSEYRPAVVIADVELPGMDGLTLLRRLGDDLTTVPAIV